MPDANDVSLVWSAVPDVLAPGLTAVFCGINPGRVSAAAAAHFANPRNDFWRLLHAAGFTPRQLDPQEQFELLRHGVGATNAAPRTTPGSGDLRRGDFAGAADGSSGSHSTSVRARSGSSARRPTAAPSASDRSSARRNAVSARRRSSSCPRRRPPTQPSPGRSGCAGSGPFARASGEAERAASPWRPPARRSGRGRAASPRRTRCGPARRRPALERPCRARPASRRRPRTV